MTSEYLNLKYAIQSAKSDVEMAKLDFESKLSKKEFDNIEDDYFKLIDLIEAKPVLLDSINQDIQKLLEQRLQDLCYMLRDSETITASSNMNIAFMQFHLAGHQLEKVAKDSDTIFADMLKTLDLTEIQKDYIHDLFDYTGVSPIHIDVSAFPYMSGDMKKQYMLDTIRLIRECSINEDGAINIGYLSKDLSNSLITAFNSDPDMSYFYVVPARKKMEQVHQLKEFVDNYFSNPDIILSDDKHTLPLQLQDVVNSINDKLSGKEPISKLMEEIAL